MKRKRIPDLISELQDEINNLDKLVKDIVKTRNEMLTESLKRKIYLESISLKLHNFYTGIERIFVKIADDVNGGVPESYDWHKRLLRTMMLEVEDRRPAVISEDTYKVLLEYLAFRHVVRNIYGFEIEEDRLQRLIDSLDTAFSSFNSDISKFFGYLREIKLS